MRNVKDKLSETTLEFIANIELKESILNLLLLACSKKNSMHGFLEWIWDVSVGEIFEQVSTWTHEETNDLRILMNGVQYCSITIFTVWRKKF